MHSHSSLMHCKIVREGHIWHTHSSLMHFNIDTEGGDTKGHLYCPLHSASETHFPTMWNKNKEILLKRGERLCIR